jgi:predicted anti-sigma-YlaC factor YlaD
MRDACSSFERLIVRRADRSALSEEERSRLDAHLASCEACRAALDQQQLVAQALRGRSESPVRPGFAARLTGRLDREDEGVLGLANWHAWTVSLAPVAAALLLAAYVGVGSSTATPTTDTAARQTPSSNETASPFENWTASAAGSSTASVFLQPSTSGDVLLETVLTGSVPTGATEGRNVR